MCGVRAFTLVELMVVIAVIAILAGIGVANYRERVIQARIATAVQYLFTYKNYFIEYYNKNGRFPPSASPSNIIVNESYLTTINYQSNTLEPNTMWVRGNLDVDAIGLPASVGNRITILIAYEESTELIISFCGKWNPGLPSLEQEYLPPMCDDVNISTLINVYN